MKKQRRRIIYSGVLAQWLISQPYDFEIIYKSEDDKFIIVKSITEPELFQLGIDFNKFCCTLVG